MTIQAVVHKARAGGHWAELMATLREAIKGCLSAAVQYLRIARTTPQEPTLPDPDPDPERFPPGPDPEPDEPGQDVFDPGSEPLPA